MEVRGESARRPRVWVWSVAGVVLLALVAVAGLAVRRAGGSGPTPKQGKQKDKVAAVAAPVELSPVRRGDIATYLENTATLEPRNTAVLVARRAGQVLSVLTEEGQWVKRGAVLLRLDDREARLAVERGEVAAEVAKRESERGRQLSEKGFLSEKELDDLRLKQRITQVELEQARYDLSQTVIVAPFSGRIVDRMVNLGETLASGKECFRVVDFNPLLARLYFPERELARVRVGQPAQLTLDAYPARPFHGRVSLVNPVVDQANGTFKVTLEVTNPGNELRPGTFARIRLKTGEFAGALLLPRRGLLNEDGEQYVFVARGDSVIRAMVQVGAVEGDTAQIIRGLAAGDRVVTVGQGGLKPGAKIKAVTL